MTTIIIIVAQCFAGVLLIYQFFFGKYDSRFICSLTLGATLLSHKDGNPLIGARLLPSLLQVLSAPCTAVQGLTTAAAVLVSLVQATPAQPSSNTQLAGVCKLYIFHLLTMQYCT